MKTSIRESKYSEMCGDISLVSITLCLTLVHIIHNKIIRKKGRVASLNLPQRASVYHARLGSRLRNSLSQVEKEN